MAIFLQGRQRRQAAAEYLAGTFAGQSPLTLAVPNPSTSIGHTMGIFVSTGGGHIPNFGEIDNFLSSVKDAKSEDLLSKLGQKNLEPWQKDAILKELETRAAKSEAAKNAGDDEDDIQKLLKKLQDGTISADELKKLAAMLGVDPAKLEAVKGQGPNGTVNLEIQGG